MKHIAVIKKPPVKSGAACVPDGAVNGNGDLGIILGSAPDGMRVYLSACGFRYGAQGKNDGGAKPLGYIDIPVDKGLYENYTVYQDMDRGELRCHFADGEKECSITLFVCKTENSVLMTVNGAAGEPVIKTFEGETAGEKGSFEKNGCTGIFRDLCGEELVFETRAAAVMRAADEKRWYTAVETTYDGSDPAPAALERALSVNAACFDALADGHYAAWERLMSASSFHLNDPELENRWYASQYILACCAGNLQFPPGLYGNFITVENPAWHSDYHLNYNYQAAFYAACSSNHPEFTDCYHAPLEDFYEKGKSFAKRFGCRGIMYPVGIDVRGICSELDPENPYAFERLFLGQKSNAVHPADIMVMRWNTTKDIDYARRHAYPYIREALRFFEDYAVFENGRYSVYRDAAHEVPYYRSDFDPEKYRRVINDKNNALTLGMLRMCLQAAIEMSAALDSDVEEREIWRDMLKKLSPFAVCRRRLRRVYRYTEKGMRWHKGNDVGLQHIYPAGCIGLESDKKTLKIAKNTLRQKKECLFDGNAACSYYPMAVRLGENPAGLLKALRTLTEKHSYDNMLFDFGCGCLENCSLHANTLNEMALQSRGGVIMLFPVWDASLDCEFSSLRTDGAFLVSSSIKNGAVGKTLITAERGGVLRFKAPFGGALIHGAEKRSIAKDELVTLETVPGETVVLSRERGR